MLLWGHSLGVPPPPPTAAADATTAPILRCEVASTLTPKPQGGSGGGEGRRWPREDFPRRMREGSGSSFWAAPPPLRVGSAVESGDTLWVPGGSLFHLVALPLGPVLGVRRRRRTIFLQAKGAVTWEKLRHVETLQEEGGSFLG